MWAWCFVGFVLTGIIVAFALAAVSEIVLPMTFAAVLAVVFRPTVDVLQRHRFRPTLAAGVVVLGLLAIMVGVVVATVRGVIEQTSEISVVTDEALDSASQQLDAAGVDRAELDEARAATEGAVSFIADGVLTHLVSGVGTLIGLASGVILGSLIMYYLLKDGTALRRGLVDRFDAAAQDDIDGFIGDSCRILRNYGRGRTVMSAAVSVVIGVASLLLGLPLVFTIVVVNFVGGYIPYIGAFLGGGLAVIVALGDGGLAEAAVMLVVVLAANLILENVVEPKVMGQTPPPPPGGRADRHRAGWSCRGDRRTHLGGARVRDRRQRDHPPPLTRCRRPRRRTCRTSCASSARLIRTDAFGAFRPPNSVTPYAVEGRGRRR